MEKGRIDERKTKRAEGRMQKYASISYLFVEFDPGKVALIVGVLETEEPHLAQPDRLHDLVEQLLPGGRRLDRELQLRVHRRHPHVHLHMQIKRRRQIMGIERVSLESPCAQRIILRISLYFSRRFYVTSSQKYYLKISEKYY